MLCTRQTVFCDVDKEASGWRQLILEVQLPQSLSGNPEGSEDQCLSTPTPVPETLFGELEFLWGPAPNCILAPEAQFWGVTEPQPLEAYALFPVPSAFTLAIRNWIQASVWSLLNHSQAGEHPVRISFWGWEDLNISSCAVTLGLSKWHPGGSTNNLTVQE